MQSVEEAQQLVFEAATRSKAVDLPLCESLGLVLGQDVLSDLDMPPFDKALVDGFAVRSADLPEGRAELTVVEEVFAGQSPRLPLAQGQAARIMTGAPIPAGADAVVMVERTTQRSPLTTESFVTIDDPRLRSGQNIMRCGTEMTRGQVVLRSGSRIRPAEIGLLATVGRSAVPTFARPHVTIISTGNEIVEANDVPGPGQIRNSNGPMLTALADRAGGESHYLGIARDTTEDLIRLVRQGLQADILLLSGGVSAGQLDLVPAVLQGLGVRQVFHQVNLKPGRPVWFGVKECGVGNGECGVKDVEPFRTPHSALRTSSLIFGLPGNPVSVMVCFELFVRPAIHKLMGVEPPGPRMLRAALAEDKTYRSDRPTYWPAWLEAADEGYRVRPLAWHGSPDLRATTEANAFVFFPPGEHQYLAGDRVQVLSTEY